MRRILILTLLVVALAPGALGQGSPAGACRAREEETIAERLGCSRHAKLWIVHADGLGVAHSVDAASTKALDAGAISSASIMVPCPWFSEIAEYARNHPGADL